ncbi:MAG: Re/Si-specific NAD(P)(+) transhydrogenase subunit alpha [Bryobacteraceae bacterium]|nr:Re/Si-specific NAD(P)(+) transhydrogenase subunit alpha [Bryobacteraceae bacterium]
MPMLIGVPKETFPGERRVALVPGVLPSLTGKGFEVLIETGAGQAAGFPDGQYEAKGARIAASRGDLAAVDIVAQVRGAAEGWREGQVAVGFYDPLSEPQTIQALAATGAAAFSMELMPRITRAQSMDALSSMATIAGYKAVILAAEHLPRLFPMLMTAAGTIAPAKVFVVGVGVAGLQAIATARRLGGVVSAYDVRPAVREQVESVGAKFVELPLETEGAEDKGGYAQAQDESFYRRQREMMARVVAESDVVITTAAVPGRKAPILITEEMVKGMAPGSVIVDLAIERGGNCDITAPGEVVEKHGVTLVGLLNLPSTAPYHASQMYAKNIATFLLHIAKGGKIDFESEDEILRETLLTRGGQVVQPRVKELLGGA